MSRVLMNRSAVGNEPSPDIGPKTDADETIPSHYVRVGRLAHGGMGYVELAFREQGSFRRLYAVKRLHPHLRDDADFRQMFLEEARIAGLIQHPNVVSVLDIGEDAVGPFLVLDYVHGLPLSTAIGLLRMKGERFPVQIVVRIAIAMARGLHAAHDLRDHAGKRLEVIHRDVSPQNVLVGWDGTARITDFGIAKALGRGVATSTGVLKGKVSYMAPEQLRFQIVDRRADLFGLGVVICEMLTNERLYPNKGENEGIRRILEEPPPDVGELRPDLPASLVHLLFSLLAKEPKDRPEDADSVARRLEATLVEVVTREPPIELGPWLRAVMSAECAESHEKLELALAEASRALSQQIAASHSEVVDDLVTTKRRAPPRGRRIGIALGAIVALGLTAWLAAAWVGAGDPPAGTRSVEEPRGRDPEAARPSTVPAATPELPRTTAVRTDEQNASAAVDTVSPADRGDAPTRETRSRAAPTTRGPTRRRAETMRATAMASSPASTMETPSMVAPALQLTGWGEGP